MDRIEKMREVVQQVDKINENIKEYQELLDRIGSQVDKDVYPNGISIIGVVDEYVTHFMPKEFGEEITKCTVMLLKDLIYKCVQESKEIINSVYGLPRVNVKDNSCSIGNWYAKCVSADIRESSKDYIDTDIIKVVKKDGATGDIYREK